MPTPPDQNLPLIVFKPFARRESRAEDAAPPGTRHRGPHPPPGTVVSRTERHHGVVVVGKGIDPRALAAAQTILDRLLANNPSAVTKLAMANTVVIIIPRDKLLTDLDEFADLRGQPAGDGTRTFDQLAGIGGHYLENGNLAVAVAEENLVRIPGARDPYGAGYSVAMHEIAHAIYRKALDDSQFKEVNRLYSTHTQAGAGWAGWTDKYAATDVHEYFAQATNAYFNQNAGVGHGGREWLRAHDPEMCALLDNVYGPPASATPTHTTAAAPRQR